MSTSITVLLLMNLNRDDDNDYYDATMIKDLTHTVEIHVVVPVQRQVHIILLNCIVINNLFSVASISSLLCDTIQAKAQLHGKCGYHNIIYFSFFSTKNFFYILLYGNIQQVKQYASSDFTYSSASIRTLVLLI